MSSQQKQRLYMEGHGSDMQSASPAQKRYLQEYDEDAADAALPPSQRLAKQRKSLKRRLGLEAGMDQLMDTDDLIKDEDLVASGSCKGQPGHSAQKDAASLISDMTGAFISLPWMNAAAFGDCIGGMLHETCSTVHKAACE